MCHNCSSKKKIINSIEKYKSTPAKYGVDNIVSILSSNNIPRYIFKKYTKKSYKEVDSLIYLYNNINCKKFKIPKIIEYGEIQNKPYVIYNYIEGEHKFNPTVKNIETIGGSIGVIANISLDGLHYKVRGISKAHQQEYIGVKLYDDVFSIIERFNTIDKKLFNKGIVHGDISPSNIIFSDQIYILDWDHLTMSNTINDIARARIFYSFDINNKINPKKDNSLINGYTSTHKLNVQELNSINIVTLYELAKILIESHYYINVIKTAKSQSAKNSFSISSFQEKFTFLFDEYKKNTT